VVPAVRRSACCLLYGLDREHVASFRLAAWLAGSCRLSLPGWAPACCWLLVPPPRPKAVPPPTRHRPAPPASPRIGLRNEAAAGCEPRHTGLLPPLPPPIIMPFKTVATELLGIEHPIVCGGMTATGSAQLAVGTNSSLGAPDSSSLQHPPAGAASLLPPSRGLHP
jgi:hypothetical protein